MAKLKRKFLKWSDNTKLALVGAGYVLRHWRYTALTVAIALGFAFLLTLFASGSTDSKLLFSTLPIADKFSILGQVFVNIFTNLMTLSGVVTLLLSFLQGVTITLLVFNYRKQHKFDSESAADSGIASIIALFGLGCSSCGTSLLMPLISIIFSSSAFVVAETVGSVITALAFVLILYAMRRLGLTSYAVVTAELHKRGQKK